MADMDYSQVGLSRLCVQNEMNQPPQEEVPSLEITLAELRRVQADLATSQAQFMEEVYTPPQEELNVNNGVDELAFTMAKLANSRVDLSINEERTPMATSYAQSKFEIHQPLQEKEMSILELVAKNMNEEEKMAKLSFEGQHESLPSILEVIREEEDSSYNEDITSSSDGELENLQ